MDACTKPRSLPKGGRKRDPGALKLPPGAEGAPSPGAVIPVKKVKRGPKPQRCESCELLDIDVCTHCVCICGVDGSSCAAHRAGPADVVCTNCKHHPGLICGLRPRRRPSPRGGGSADPPPPSPVERTVSRMIAHPAAYGLGTMGDLGAATSAAADAAFARGLVADAMAKIAARYITTYPGGVPMSPSPDPSPHPLLSSPDDVISGGERRFPSQPDEFDGLLHDAGVFVDFPCIGLD